MERDAVKSFNLPPILQGILFKKPNNKLLKELLILTSASNNLKTHYIDLANQGANLEIIHNVLKKPDIPEYLLDDCPAALELYGGQFHPDWVKAIEKHEEKRKKVMNDTRKMSRAIKVITSLKPIPNGYSDKDETDFINTRLGIAQEALRDIERHIDRFFTSRLMGYSTKWGLSSRRNLIKGEYKTISKGSHSKELNKRINTLVDELIRIRFTDKKAYTKTAELLETAFPHIYFCNQKTLDSDIIRQRYTYKPTKKKTASK